MSCCNMILKDINYLTKKLSKIKELKKFSYILSNFNENNKEIILYELCNERINIYIKNDIKTLKIQKYIMICDNIIKLIQTKY